MLTGSALALACLQPIGQVSERCHELLLRYAGDGWSGAALVAQADEVLLAGGYGFANFEAGRANTDETLFDVGGLTMPFTATAVLLLAQEGRLALDESIGVVLPGVPQHSRKITPRHLLAHTSGVPGHFVGGRGQDLSRAVVELLASGPEATPGTRHEFWYGGYALLAGVIERASGVSYAAFLEERVFAPAGMAATGFCGDPALDAARLALGRTAGGEHRSALEPNGADDSSSRGQSGLVTSVRDLHRFDRALATGRLLDPAHLVELFTPVTSEFALGWHVRRAFDGSEGRSHAGTSRGFAAHYRRLPERDACIVVLANDDQAAPWVIGDNLECLLLGRPPIHPAPATRPLGADEAYSYAGTYVGAAGRLVVRAAEGVLVAGIEGQALLEALGGSSKLDWKADRDALSLRSVEIVEALARSDTAPLRTHLRKHIPLSEVERLRREAWPAHLARHGAYLGARPIGAVARQDRLEVVLALEHEGSPGRSRLTFDAAGLLAVELDPLGAIFAASARLERVRKGAFRILLGEAPTRLEFDLSGRPSPSVRASGLKLVRAP